MPKQPAFPGLRDAMKEKVTRRELFLAEMDAVVPWTRLVALIAPHYPKAGLKGGRPPMPLETMLRVYFLPNWYALSDPMAEETLYDSEAMRRFAGIELGDDRVPDETTILNFRHLLERHGLTEAIFAEVNAHLADKGITLRSGTLVDATIIAAPSSTKNKASARPRNGIHQEGQKLVFRHESAHWRGAQSRYFHRQAARQSGLGRPAARRGNLGLGRVAIGAPSARPRSPGQARSGAFGATNDPPDHLLDA